eukprot:358848-Chlamydomonas_euryale.AAC.8
MRHALPRMRITRGGGCACCRCAGHPSHAAHATPHRWFDRKVIGDDDAAKTCLSFLKLQGQVVWVAPRPHQQQPSTPGLGSATAPPAAALHIRSG